MEYKKSEEKLWILDLTWKNPNEITIENGFSISFSLKGITIQVSPDHILMTVKEGVLKK